MRIGSDVKFKGFLRNLGKGSDRKSISRQRNVKSNSDDDEILMPMFTVFELEIVKQFDELPTNGNNRKGHHHLHKDVRYSINTSSEANDD